MNNWLEILSSVILYIVASYFIFYRSWLKAIGKEVAKLSTVEKITELRENIKKDFNKQIENYKNKLNEELSLKIEPLKFDLAKNNITHQIQYSYLHQERSRVVLEIYKNLQELHSAMVSLTSALIDEDIDVNKKRIVRVNNAMDCFRNHYLVNKLFFTKEFCIDIDNLFQEYWDKIWDYKYNKTRIDNGELPTDFFILLKDEMFKISKDVREVLPKKIEEIEEKFRLMLKVNDKV